MISKIVIIGGGPCGVSAGLYLSRSGKDVTIIDNGESALRKAENIDNYYGMYVNISGEQLYAIGIEQAKRNNAKVINDSVVDVEYDIDNTYMVGLASGEKLQATHLVIATGIGRIKPKINNLVELEGKGVSYCAVCDAFFAKGKNVAVIGDGDYALSEASHLANLVKSLKILTNGKVLEKEVEYQVNDSKIKAIIGEDRVTGIELESGEILPVEYVFVAIGTLGASSLAKKLGIETDLQGKIKVNNQYMTSIPNIYAGGDCISSPYQIAKAVYNGMIIAENIAKN